MTKARPRNPMDGEMILHRRIDPVPEDAPASPDIKQLNGREIAEHEVDPVREARLAERAEAADGILSGLIKKPRLLGMRAPWWPLGQLRAGDAQEPADEVADECPAPAGAGRFTECVPEVLLHPDGVVLGVGLRLWHGLILLSGHTFSQRNPWSRAVRDGRLCVSSRREGGC